MISVLLRTGVPLLLYAVCASPAQSQGLISAEELPAAVGVLDTAPSKNSLPCSIDVAKKAQLDFVFRYTTRFSIECDWSPLLAGSPLFALLRVTPENREPVVMIEEFDVPNAIANDPERYEIAFAKELKMSMGGGFATGPGRYSAEVVLTDEHGHTSRKQRQLTVNEVKMSKHVPTILARGTVAPLLDVRWDGKLAATGLRLAVLLHVTKSADGAFLLPSVSSLLGEIPCQSVKLSAFNLDRQEEIFHQDHLDGDAFASLKKILQEKEFVTIPYNSLERGASGRFLVDMARREAEEQPDAIVFLGLSGADAWEKISKDALATVKLSNTRVFYLKYFARPGRPPDALERLTKGLHGSAFPVYSAEGLAQAFRKILAEVRPDIKKDLPAPVHRR